MLDITKFLTICGIVVASVTWTWAADEGLLFYAPFETDAKPVVANGNPEPPYNNRVKIGPGRVDNAVSVMRGTSQLIYDGAGNAHTQAGTVSFFWRPDEAATQGATVLDLSPLDRMNYNRFIQLSYASGKFSIYFTAGNRGAIGLTSNSIPIEDDPWTHVALCWDQTKGIALYVNGQKSAEKLMPWVYDGLVNQIGLGQTTRGDFRPDTATLNESFDELRIYDRWLDDDSIAALARGEAPQLKPIDLNALLAMRRAAYRWDEEGAATLPELHLGEGLGLRQVGVATAKDVGRTSWRAFDGERGRRWPDGAGYADAGEALRIALDGPQRFDVMQLYGRGNIALTTDEKAAPLLARDFGDPSYHRLVLPTPVTTDKLELQRVPVAGANGGPPQRSGGVFEMGLFERTAYTAPGTGWQRLPLAPASEADQRSPALLAVRRAFYSTDQQALFAREVAGGGAMVFPAMRAVHFVGPSTEERRGLAAIALDLKLKGGAAGGVARVEVADPLTSERFLTSIDIRLTGTGNMRLLFDHRDIVLPPNVGPRVSVTFRDDTEVDLAASSISYQWTGVDAALPQHMHDQLARAKDVFQEISEARSWHYWRTLPAVGLLHNIIQELFTIRPEEPVVRSYWHWINPALQKAMVPLPPVPANVPPWAVYLDGSIEALKKVPYWWIDHRENKFGEFGANDGINDDTDLVMDWWAMYLMRGPDAKLFQSVKRVANRSWDITMRRSGLGHFTDALHTYEDGINAQCHMALMDYGNPVYMERLLATARHYKELMGVNPAGHLHFYDDRYGWSESKEQPGTYIGAIKKSDRDEGYNALMLQPAILLGWYNGNAACIDTVKQWTDAMMAHYIIDDKGVKRVSSTDVVWATDANTGRGGGSFGYGFLDLPYALWELTGDAQYRDFLRMCIDAEVAQYGYPRAAGCVTDRYIAATGDKTLKERMIARASDPRLWVGSIHNDNYYELDPFYLAWQLGGDIKFINDGLKLTLNDTIWELPMLTEGEQSTDRVWTPQRVANRVALGGPAMLRNELYPKLGASWENATGRIAPFVTGHDAAHLQTWIQNLEGAAVKVNMRVWHLDHGKYTIEEGVDADRDGAFDGKPTMRTATLARFDTVALTVPPGGTYLVKLTQTAKLDDIRLRPDLAICVDDATYDPAKRELRVVVHNIGAKPSGEFTVRATAGGKTLLTQKLPSLDAPTDLQPKTATLTLTADPAAAVVVEVEPGAGVAEITQVNNRLSVAPGSLPATR